MIAVPLTSHLNPPNHLSQLVRFPSGHSFLVKTATGHDFNYECAISLSSMSPRAGYWNPAGWLEIPPRIPPDSECSQSPTPHDMWSKVTPIHFPWSFGRFYIITEHRSLSATCNTTGFCLWISGFGMCVRRLGGSSVPTLYFVPYQENSQPKETPLVIASGVSVHRKLLFAFRSWSENK